MDKKKSIKTTKKNSHDLETQEVTITLERDSGFIHLYDFSENENSLPFASISEEYWLPIAMMIPEIDTLINSTQEAQLYFLAEYPQSGNEFLKELGDLLSKALMPFQPIGSKTDFMKKSD